MNDELLTAEEIYINVNGRPFIPSGYEDIPYLTNQNILELEKVPEHLLVAGGNYIDLKFGQMFRRFGAKVTIIGQVAMITGREDDETNRTIQQFMKEEEITFMLGAECLSATKNEDGSISNQINYSKDGTIKLKGSHILLAVGRRSNTDSLQLEKTGVKVSDRGFIEVNDYLETNIKGIYALGDCNGKGSFTHNANNDYEIIAENKLEGKNRKISDRILTSGLFVDPPFGRVGITKREAQEKGLDILIGHWPLSKISRAKEKGETSCYMSVVVDAKTKKILGATMLGVDADKIISSFINIMYAEASYELIRDSIQPHPNVSELIPTMLESLSKP